MKWDEAAVQGFRDHLQRIGLRSCPVCGSEALGISDGPVYVSWSGAAWREQGDTQYDPQANVLFMVLVECELCGNALFFNSERISPRDQPVLRRGV